jgi:hypothetical protein
MQDEKSENAETQIVVETQEREEINIRAELQKEYDSRLEVEVNKISQQMIVENKKVVEAAIERFRKEMAPPSEEDIQKLLSQEYVEFKIEVPVKGEIKHFTLRELPIAVEKKMFKRVKTILVPFASDLTAISIESI